MVLFCFLLNIWFAYDQKFGEESNQPFVLNVHYEAFIGKSLYEIDNSYTEFSRKQKCV